ncbi:Hypothetical protein, putative [Bodo saltans]|uniref:F-box domain-containing protein n=1 Tax=Bodo saltans TaxID=75058 RepID=A0A0S4J8D6_BODSA|nr:Hypothetical protein, putative [Bodo saltans]|eukprot:CUG81746.1 Hypothetical protein, putative [Bodo saltans]
MPTHRETTSAPIICHSVEEVEACAALHHAQLIIAEDDVGLISIVVDASKSGRWVCLLCSNVSNATLREVVYQVWLKSTWLHHPEFRAWFVDARFVPPPKEELLHGFGAPRLEELPPAHGVTDASLIAKMAEDDTDRLPYLLVRSAVYLQFCDNFDDEFRARELITAVADLELYRTEDARKFVHRLTTQDLVDLFRLAKREDVMIALAERGNDDERDREYIIGARDRNGRSPLDIAIEKNFKKAAVLLRNLGCKSESFKFERLLDPNFQPMLRELIDPWKQFPFDPVQSLRKVAIGGQGSILRKLFDCRVDVNFGYEEYPVAEACESGCDDVAWIVLDRMGVTGVSPFQEARCASYHLVRTLMYCFEHPTTHKASKRKMIANSARSDDDVLSSLADPNVPSRSQTSFSNMEPLSATALWVLHRLADVCLLDGGRFPIPLASLCRAESNKDLMPKLLKLIDVDEEPNTEGLLEFFIFFDPTNELSRRLTKKAFTNVGEGDDVEVKVYNLVWQMIRQGEKALPMTHWGVELVCFRQYFPMTFRGHGGDTILMKCLERPPNIGAMESLLTTMSRSVKEKAMEQPDLNGNNALKKLVVTLSQDPDMYGDYMAAYGNAVRLLLDHGMKYKVSAPAFTADLFTLAARQELGDLCYELMPTRERTGSIVLACSMNTLALMWRRWRRLQQQPIQKRIFTSVFEEGETKWRINENLKDQSTGTEDLSYVTNVVDTGKYASAILTEAEKKPYERFTVDVPDPSAPPLTTLDVRVDKARVPHPTFGDNILTLLNLEILAHICSYVPVRSIRFLSRVSTSFLYASLFDNVWIDRQVSELFPNAKKTLRSLHQHTTQIQQDKDNVHMSPPALDFIYGAHPLESSRSIFMMHTTEHWQQQQGQ